MVWIVLLLAVAAMGGAGFLALRWSEERKANQRLRSERMQLADEIEGLKSNQNRLLRSVPMSNVGSVADQVAREVDSPIGFAHSQLEGVGELLDDYRKLVKNYDAAVQYCLQPVEMIFGADKAGLDQLVKHVEEARRRLFMARVELEKSTILSDSKAILSEAVSGLGRSSHLVQSLRRLTRSDSEGLEAVDLHQLIDSVLNLTVVAWGDRLVVVREYGELPNVTCMPAQIARVFLSVLDNAATAIEGRGRITVHTRAGGIRNVEIKISDSGTGIPGGMLSEVFDPFTTSHGEALGLGLHLSQAIVKAHGGSINVRSSSGEGTVVVISLPVVAASQAAALAAPRR